jgi:hypothetical protein
MITANPTMFAAIGRRVEVTSSGWTPFWLAEEPK